MSLNSKVKSNLFRFYITNLNNQFGFDWLILLEYKAITQTQIQIEALNAIQNHRRLQKTKEILSTTYSFHPSHSQRKV